MAIIYGITDSEKKLLAKLPKEVKSVDDIDRVRKDFFKKIRNQRKGYGRKSLFGIVFSEIKRFHYKRQVDKFQYKKIGRLQTGTRGENKVIDELMKLDDNYHVLCGVEIELDRWVTYNGTKNLRSAQMDIIVISTKGVYMIEVKNWSNQFANNNNSFSPYEQTARAGRVLWISLQDWIGDIRVTNVLLSIKGNLPYNKNYRSVFVSSLGKINQFLEKRQDILSEKEVQKIVDFLKNHVTC